LRAGDWARASELLKASETPPAALSNLGFLARALTDFTAGMQALDAGEIAKAEEASQRLDAELWRISQELKAEEDAKDAKDKDKKALADAGAPKMQVMPDAQGKPLVSNVSIMSLELRAGLLLAKKQTEDAKKLYAQAAREEKDLGYREPPGYIRPVAETEAAAMLTASAWTDAKASYQKALAERPKSGFPLYGIALSSERAGDAKAASAEYAEFVAAWKDADAGLPQLGHARAFLAEHGSVVATAKQKAGEFDRYAIKWREFRGALPFVVGAQHCCALASPGRHIGRGWETISRRLGLRRRLGRSCQGQRPRAGGCGSECCALAFVRGERPLGPLAGLPSC
jgi:hypothetical protein